MQVEVIGISEMETDLEYDIREVRNKLNSLKVLAFRNPSRETVNAFMEYRRKVKDYLGL